MLKQIDKMVTLADGSILYEFIMDGYAGRYYVPASDMQINLINYGFTAPAFVVFPNEAMDFDDVPAYAEEKGFAELARKQGTGVLIMNPGKGQDWSEEEPGAYEICAGHFGIAQSNFRDGLGIMTRPGCNDERSYVMLGSCVRMYVYAIGSGADYISSHAIRPIKGDVSLGDMGRADLTMTCVTLVEGKQLPKPQDSDIIVISVGNSVAYNAALEGHCGLLVQEDTVDYRRDFLGEGGRYRRWVGKVVPAYNYEAEGIVAECGSCMVPVSDDNEVFGTKFGPFGPKEHKVGYVAFYDEKLDVKAGKVPVLLIFHGGGDCAYCTASVAEWPEIAQQEGFLAVAVEMHMQVSAREMVSLVDHLAEVYSIDRSRVYGTGFSMGGVKSWDLFTEVPETFAAVAPMDAIVYPGANCFGGKTAAERMNKDTLLPVFYIGGLDSFGVELPVHDPRAIAMLAYACEVNKTKKKYDVTFEDKDNWEDPLLGVAGDQVQILEDPAFPQSVYSLNSYESENGRVYTQILSVTNHAHEIRPFTCRKAWEFISRFRRNEAGRIEILGEEVEG